MAKDIFRTAVIGVIAGALMPIAAKGQCSEWVQRTPGMSPSARGNTGTAYHPSNGVVLFGGGCGTLVGDTWAWNGSSWSKLAQSGPSARSAHRMVYDAARNEIVLFGGNDGSYRNDMWRWSGSGWQEIPASGSWPSVRAHHGLAYDESRQVVVLFGGWDGGSYLGDTWEWDGSSWTKVSQSGPSAREGHAMAFHPSNGIVLFGGGAGSPDNETWAWNGTIWTKLTGAGNQPLPQRYWNAMAYAASLQRIVLFGGGDANTNMNDTWSWDGARWCVICANDSGQDPTPRFNHTMAFDPARGKTILFGGDITQPNCLADTWEFPVSAAPACIPTVSTWGLAVLALVLMIGGTSVLGRRRAAGRTPIETA